MLSSLDITCCDIEPGVFGKLEALPVYSRIIDETALVQYLARNILLFTLIIDYDEGKVDQLWNIFYDMFITDSVATIISSQCKKLAEVSKSLEEWSSSPFAPYLRMCNAATLENLRRYWLLYAEFESLPSARRERVRKAFKDHLDTSKDNATYHFSSGRSGGPRWQNLLVPISIHGSHYRHAGVTSMQTKDVKLARYINPTFAYSFMGEGCAVHYETQPLAAFHLAAAPLDPKGDALDSSTGRANAAVLLQFAQSQFATWCATFKHIVQDVDSALVLRFYIGDALSFCRALRHVRLTSSISTSLASSWWRGSTLKLDGGDYTPESDTPAPLMFNVIDTSNLMDHVGPANLLLVTEPLLTSNTFATLYTESLAVASRKAIKTFDDYLCGDLTTVSLFLDLTPTTFLTKFTTMSSGYEIMMSHILNSASDGEQRLQQRLAWKRPSTLMSGRNGSSLVAEPRSLGRFLLSVYLKMFAHESPGSTYFNLLHDTRTTFAVFLETVKLRLSPSTSWPLVMDHFLELIETDRTLLLGLNHYQELCCQMHLLNVHSVSPMQDFTARLHVRPSAIHQSHFRKWKEIPTFVCLTLLIPRDRIQAVLDSKPDSTPTLLCNIFEQFVSSFSTLFGAFGTIQAIGEGSERTLVMQEDLDGLFGSSSMIISCHIPTWILVAHPDSNVNLAFHPNISTLPLVRLLGDRLVIYETKATDKQHVFITRERPAPSGNANLGVTVATSTREPATAEDINCVSLSFDSSCSRVIKLSRRIDIVDMHSKNALSSGACLEDEQLLPSQITVKCGSQYHDFNFPFPVDGSSTKLRVARQAFYIEVRVFISSVQSSSS